MTSLRPTADTTAPPSAPRAARARACLPAALLVAACAILPGLVLGADAPAAPPAAAPAAAPGAVQAVLLAATGAAVRGVPRLAHGQVNVAGTSIPVEQVVALSFERYAGSYLDQGVILNSGEILGGVVQSLQADKLTLASDHFGILVLPVSKVQALLLSACPLASCARQSAGESAGAILINGDQLAGTASFVNDLMIGINNGRRIVEIARSRVAQVRLASVPAAAGASAGAAAKAPPAVQHLRLVTGERIDGRIDALDEQSCTIDTGWAQAVTVPAGLVLSLWSDGGALTPLSSVHPTLAKQIGQFDETAALRLDRNQRLGFLTVSGVRAERGLGCQPRCELSYQLDGGLSSLVGEVGIDDLAGMTGAADFQVFVDGKLSFHAAAHGTQAVQLMVVPLAGAKLLQVVVDFGPAASLPGAADICWPVLVRGIAPGR